MRYRIVFVFAISLFFLQSCKVLFPNRMFKQGNYEYFQPSDNVINQYLIQPGDLITLEIYSRNGFDLVDVFAVQDASNMRRQDQQETYLVDQDGYVDFPIFGKMFTVGQTENQLEELLKEKSAELFNDPFIVLRVVNRRAFVFRGSEASVVSLNENPTSLIEVLAKAGGLSRNLKSYNIKIIRGDLSNPEIIEIDLSTMDGLTQAELIVQANDVIYIEERLQVAQGVLREISPVLSLLTSFTTIIVLVTNQ